MSYPTPNLWHNTSLLALVAVTSLALGWALREARNLRDGRHARDLRGSQGHALAKSWLSPWAIGWWVWQITLAALAFTGFFAVLDQPWRALPTLVLTMALTAWFALSRSSAWLLLTPRSFWVGLQSFRLPLELLLYNLYQSGVIGRQMTFAGLNYDIVIGITAPGVAFVLWRVARHRLPAHPGKPLHSHQAEHWAKRWTTWGAILWNVLGLCLLANIVVVAVLSIPFPFQHFTQEPANRMVTAFPFVWLPTFLVPVALFAHLVSLRCCIHDLKN